MLYEKIVLNEEKAVVLTAYIPDKYSGNEIRNVPTVIIFPGGGYKLLSPHEGECVALAYASMGFNAFVLNYSVGENYETGQPLKDYEKAYEYIMQRAEEWHIQPNKLCVVGFSAGGHLAACTSVMSKYRPAAAVLGYAVTLQTTLDALSMNAQSPIDFISEKTCPTFLFCSSDDRVVPTENTLLYALKLKENKTDCELHVYSHGNHGFSLSGYGLHKYFGDGESTRTRNWLADSAAWIIEVLENKNTKIECVSDGLCIDSPVAELLKNNEIRKVIIKYLPALSNENQLKQIGGISLRRILGYKEETKPMIKLLSEQIDLCVKGGKL